MHFWIRRAHEKNELNKVEEDYQVCWTFVMHDSGNLLVQIKVNSSAGNCIS